MKNNLDKILLNRNIKFRWKVIQDLEKIDLTEYFPKFPIIFLTSMDPRIDINRIFQLNPGDVLILRNAGNILTIDMLRSILIATHEYKIKYIVILGHLDCGMTKIDLLKLREKLYLKSRELIIRNGNNPYSELRNFFKPFKDVLQNINEQVESLRDFKGFPSDVKIRGWLYDVHTGWVFETENLGNYESTEEFMKSYREHITKKDLELVDSLISLEKESLDPKSIIQAHEEERSPRSIELMNKNKILNDDATQFTCSTNGINKNNLSNDILMKGSRITIPKISVPKISVNVPEIYKRKKQKRKI